jgi:flavin reductase (DIM6/NTAB) family NADH-FMN oxidoreductase RutF
VDPPQGFPQVIGNFASGVTVITMREQDTNYGLTASAVTSLTLEPPYAAGLHQQEYGNTSSDYSDS